MSGPCTNASTIANRFCHPPDRVAASTSRSLEAGAPESFGKASSALRRMDLRPFHRVFRHRAHGRAGFEFGILLDVADPEPLAERNFSAVRIFVAGQNSQQRGFAGTVRSDKPNAVTLRDGKRHVLK